jgi:hypothetical protein
MILACFDALKQLTMIKVTEKDKETLAIAEGAIREEEN